MIARRLPAGISISVSAFSVAEAVGENDDAGAAGFDRVPGGDRVGQAGEKLHTIDPGWIPGDADPPVGVWRDTIDQRFCARVGACAHIGAEPVRVADAHLGRSCRRGRGCRERDAAECGIEGEFDRRFECLWRIGTGDRVSLGGRRDSPSLRLIRGTAPLRFDVLRFLTGFEGVFEIADEDALGRDGDTIDLEFQHRRRAREVGERSIATVGERLACGVELVEERAAAPGLPGRWARSPRG